jgi:hypothetical protein
VDALWTGGGAGGPEPDTPVHRVRKRLTLRLETLSEVAHGEHLAGGAGDVADQLVRHVGERLLDESVAQWVVGLQLERVKEAAGALGDDPLGERLPGETVLVDVADDVGRRCRARRAGPLGGGCRSRRCGVVV